jgi:hypothetical protein
MKKRGRSGSELNFEKTILKNKRMTGRSGSELNFEKKDFEKQKDDGEEAGAS